MGQIEDPAALREAQEILVRCGALSFCAYKMVELSREARARVSAIAPPDRQPLVAMMERVGVEAPVELIHREV